MAEPQYPVSQQPDASEKHWRGWQRAYAAGSFTVEATTDEILRVAIASTGAAPHRTWALASSVADLSAPTVEVEDQGNSGMLRTDYLQAEMSVAAGPNADERLRMAISRRDGSVVMTGIMLGRAEDGRLTWQSSLADGERVFGGGERTGTLDRRGRRLTFWTTDPLPNHGKKTDAMYQSVPFLIGLVDGRAYGVYFDVNERAVADIGKRQPDTLTYTPESDDLVAYVFGGPTLADVLRQYTSLTGRMPSLPRWSFGNQQSRWSYMSADEIHAIADEYRARAIPCDAIYLDIDYMDGYRVFTWSPERFPDPAGLIRTLREQHFRLVTIIDPGVKVDPSYRVFAEGAAKGFFVRNPDGSPFEGWVWPGLSCWVDFARDDARAWWSEQHRALVAAGVAGIWNDMNEPSQAGISTPPDIVIPHGATLPDDVLHGEPGEPLTHVQFHNAYGLEMTRATYEALQRLRADERPFVLTRSATAGSQRYAVVWNGDSTSSWANLQLAVPLNLGMSLSGFPMTGGDIGGFWEDVTAELFVRWTQLGALLPFCRFHSAMGTVRQEPWAFGEPYTSLCRAALERRYQLLPYLLTLAQEATTNGTPIIRPLAWIAPTHAVSLACNDQFLLGDALLVAPVVEEGVTTREVILPPGEWFAWDDDTLVAGDQRLSVPVSLATMPLYVRAGTILPLAAAAQSTDDMTDQPLTLHVYLTPDSPMVTTEMWLDDEHPQAEQRETFGQWQMQAAWRDEEIAVTMRREGGQLAWPYPGCSVALHLPDGWHAAPVDPTATPHDDTFDLRYRVSRG